MIPRIFGNSTAGKSVYWTVKINVLLELFGRDFNCLLLLWGRRIMKLFWIIPIVAAMLDFSELT
jgi:hypothetical protein